MVVLGCLRINSAYACEMLHVPIYRQKDVTVRATEERAFL